MTATLTARRPSAGARHATGLTAQPQWRPAVVAGQSPALAHGRRCLPTEVSAPVVDLEAARNSRRLLVRARARRRNLVLGVAALAILVALALPWGGAGGNTLAASGPVLAGATSIAPVSYTVQPGDTMWSIAQRLEPRADPRLVVADIEAQIGSDTLQPGEHINLP